MYYLNVVLTVKDASRVESIHGLLAQQGRLSRDEPGCLRFEVYHSQTDPKVFLLVERWETSEALDVHRTAKAYTEIYKPHVLPKVTRAPHPAQLVDCVVFGAATVRARAITGRSERQTPLPDGSGSKSGLPRQLPSTGSNYFFASLEPMQ